MTHFGLPAVECVDPKGEVSPYLVAEVSPAHDEARAWLLTKADGTQYRVCRYADGRWDCSCNWWVLKARHQLPQGTDKHIAAVVAHLEASRHASDSGAGGGASPPPESEGTRGAGRGATGVSATASGGGRGA